VPAPCPIPPSNKSTTCYPGKGVARASPLKLRERTCANPAGGREDSGGADQDDRFPAIEPFDSGLLDVGDGHQVSWSAAGIPAGKPALYLHGGPGSGCSPGQRRFFDPDAYRFVLFDQRGSVCVSLSRHQSLPVASDP